MRSRLFEAVYKVGIENSNGAANFIFDEEVDTIYEILFDLQGNGVDLVFEFLNKYRPTQDCSENTDFVDEFMNIRD
jgi:hypothetical protein